MDILSNIRQGQLENKVHIAKALSGVYKPNDENRKLGRVGQHYGEIKQPEIESTGYQVIDKLIEVAKPLVDKVILEARKKAEEKLERFTKYDEEMIDLSLKFDLINALSKYIDKKDSLVSVKLSNSSKGSFELNGIISRDGKDHSFNTEVIYAGGYNIQKLHYRYLVKTNLPKVASSTAAISISEKIKKLNKEGRIREDINRYEGLIVKTKSKIEEAENMSDEDILDKHEYYREFSRNTWQDMIDRGADKNFDNDESKYNIYLKTFKDDVIKQFKHSRITVDKNRVKEFEEEIKKLESKLKSI